MAHKYISYGPSFVFLFLFFFTGPFKNGKRNIYYLSSSSYTMQKSEDKVEGDSKSDSKKAIVGHKPNKAIQRVTIQESEKGFEMSSENTCSYKY